MTPSNTVAPAITGTTAPGSVLTATAGTWVGSTPITYSYQWEDCNTSGVGCTNIAGATSSTYALQSSDVGDTIVVAVTASNASLPGGSLTTASSAATSVVQPVLPTNTVAPAITGTPGIGATLVASAGSWSGSAPIAYSYQWEDCNAAGTTCTNITGATSSTYVVQASDAGSYLVVSVSAANTAGTSAAAPSAPLGPASEITGDSLSSNSIPTVPATAAPGNLILVSVNAFQNGGTPTVATPTGYTPGLYETDNAGYTTVQAVYYKWATAGDIGNPVPMPAPSNAQFYQVTVLTAATRGVLDSGWTRASGGTGELLAPASLTATGPGESVVAFNAAGGYTPGTVTATIDPAWTGVVSAVTYGVDSAWETEQLANGASSSGGTISWSGIDFPDDSMIDVLLAAPPTPGAPINTTLPSISGTAENGQTLTASPGAWTNSPTSYSYQWEDCTTVTGGGCTSIPGATSPTYVLQSSDASQYVAVVVTASNDSGQSAVVTSMPTTEVLDVPANTAAPSIAGTAIVGRTLTAATGTWTGSTPISYSYQWEDCNSSGTGCTNISGATSSTYTLQTADMGSTVTVAVQATNTAGQTTVAAPPTGVVGAQLPVNTAAPAVSGTAAIGQTLTASLGSWTGSTPISYSYQWDDCNQWYGCAAIASATGSTYTVGTADVGQTVEVIVTADNSSLPGGGRTSASSAATATVPSVACTPSISSISTFTTAKYQTVTISGTCFGIPGPSSTGVVFADLSQGWTGCNGTNVWCYFGPWTNDSITFTNFGGYYQYFGPSLNNGDLLNIEISNTQTNAGPAECLVVVGAAGGSNCTLPDNTVAPAITGTAALGQTLTASTGTWSGSTPINYSYQWEDCDQWGDACTAISGANGSTYTVGTGDIGQKIAVAVTADNSNLPAGGTERATSSATTVVPSVPCTPSIDAVGPVTTNKYGSFAITGTCFGVTGSSAGAPGVTFWDQSGGWTGCNGTNVWCYFGPWTNDSVTFDDFGGYYQYFGPSLNNGDLLDIEVPNAQTAAGPGQCIVLVGAPATNCDIPADDIAPSIAGTPAEGQTLTASPGTWYGAPPFAYTYQWEDCDSTGANCTAISGATTASYQLQASDVGSTIEVDVTATNNTGNHTVASAPTTTVTQSAPVNTSPVTITGIGVLGQTLTAQSGSFVGTHPISDSYQWSDCAPGGTCTPISGATSSTYALTSSDLGDYLEVVETATNSLGSTTTTAETSYQIVSAPPANTVVGSVSGAAAVGNTLTAQAGTWTQTPTYGYQWEDCSSQLANRCTAIPSATGNTYTVQPSDLGSNIAVRITATNQAGVAAATSVTSGTVGPAFTPGWIDGDTLILPSTSEVWMDLTSPYLVGFDVGLAPGMTGFGTGICEGDCRAPGNAIHNFGTFPAGSKVGFTYCNALGVQCGTAISYQDTPNIWYEVWEANGVYMIAGNPPGATGSLGWPAVGDGNGLQNINQCSVADPVNCASGNFVQTATDLAIPGRGVPLNLTRTYNSLAAGTEGMFGYGWTSAYEMSLTFDAYGDATVHQAGGAQATFYAFNGGFVAPPWVLGGLAQNSDGTYTLTERGGRTYTFSQRGQLVAEGDRNNYSTTLSYNDADQLTTVTDPEGRTLTFGYSNGMVSSVSDSAGRTVDYYYDANGNLTKVIDAAQRTWMFDYADPTNHLLTTVTDPNNGATKNVYDTSGRVISQTDPAGLTTTLAYSGDSFSPSGGTTTVTGPHNEVTLENYTDGNLMSETRGYGTADAATWTYQYGPTNNVSYERDPNGNVTTATYDSSGNLLSRTNAASQTQTYTYNSFDEPLTATDNAGIETSYSYDANGNLQTKTVTGTGTSPIVETTHYTYGDSYPGDVTEIKDPANHITDYSYDQYGNVTSATRYPSAGVSDTTSYVYDSLGRRLCEASPNATTAGVQCPVAGQPRVADTTTWTYNADGNVLSKTNPVGNEIAFRYDGDGNETQVRLPSGDVTEVSYDGDSRPLTITTGYGTASAATTSYTYDIGLGTAPCNAEVADALYCTAATAPGGQTIVTWLNSRGEQVQQTQPAAGTINSTYDLDGNLRTRTTQSGTVAYGYNEMNQPTAITYSSPANGFGATPNVTYSYTDPDGRLTAMTDGTGTTTYSYDSLKRLQSVTNAYGQSVGYGYNLDNQVNQLNYPGAANQNVTYGFDGAGEETSVSDWLGNTTNFGYDSDGNIRSEVYPGGITDSSTYYTDDELASTSVAANASPTSPIASYSYTYNQNGELASETDLGLPASASQSYGYNTNQQLVSAGNTQYAYDATGSVTTLNGNSGYQYNPAGQLTQSPASADLNQTSPQPTTYSYDPLGDRTSASSASGLATTYSYDQVGELTGIADGGTAIASYTYDGNGLRTSKTIGSTAYQYAYDTAGSVPVVLTDGQTSFVYGPEGPVEQISSSGTARYLHHDVIGSTRLILDQGGNVVGSFSYSPYGVSSSTGSEPTALGYAGAYTDAESGLMYLHARYYDPATAQFMSSDPLEAVTHQPYSYVYDAPTNGTDPTGLDCSPLDPGGCINDVVGTNLGGDILGGVQSAANAAAPYVSVIGGAASSITGFAGAACVAGVELGPLDSVPCGAFGVASTISGGVTTLSDLYQALNGNGGAAMSLPFDLIGLGAGPGGEAIDGLLRDAPEVGEAGKGLGEAYGSAASGLGFAGGVGWIVLCGGL